MAPAPAARAAPAAALITLLRIMIPPFGDRFQLIPPGQGPAGPAVPGPRDDRHLPGRQAP